MMETTVVVVVVVVIIIIIIIQMNGKCWGIMHYILASTVSKSVMKYETWSTWIVRWNIISSA